jgi:hypothetical protein
VKTCGCVIFKGFQCGSAWFHKGGEGAVRPPPPPQRRQTGRLHLSLASFEGNCREVEGRGQISWEEVVISRVNYLFPAS